MQGKKRTLQDNIRKQRNLLKSMEDLSTLCCNLSAPYKVNVAYRNMLHATYKRYIRLTEVIRKQINAKVQTNVRWFKLENKMHGR